MSLQQTLSFYCVGIALCTRPPCSYFPDGRMYERMDWPGLRSLYKGDIVKEEEIRMVSLTEGSPMLSPLNCLMRCVGLCLLPPEGFSGP